MVSAGEFGAQISEARETLQARQQDVIEEEEKIREQELFLESLRTERPERKLGFQQDPKFAQQFQRFQEEQQYKREASPQIAEAKKQIKDYKKTLEKREQEIKQAEAQLSAYESVQQELADFEQAKKLYEKGIPSRQASGNVRKYLRQFEFDRATAEQGLENLKQELAVAPQTLPTTDMPSITSSSIESYFAPQFRSKLPSEFQVPQPTSRIPQREFDFGAWNQPQFTSAVIQEQLPETSFKDIVTSGYQKIKEQGLPDPVKQDVQRFKEKAGFGAELQIKTISVGGVTIPLGLTTEDWEKMKPTKATQVFTDTIPVKEFTTPIKEVGARAEKEEQKIEKPFRDEAIGFYEPTYSVRYSDAFQKRYGDAVNRGEITFDQAIKKFEQTEEAKKIQAEYNQKVNERIEQQMQEANLPVFTRQNFKIAGYKAIGMFGGFIPTTVGELATLEAGVGAILLAPPYLVTGAVAYGTARETKQALDPTARGSERILSGAMAGAGVGFLTYAGVRALRKPVLTTKDIYATETLTATQKTPKISAPTGRVVYKDVTGETLIKETAKFTRTEEQLTAGRRTVVTTRGRQIVSDYLKLDVKPIYEGVPYVDKGFVKYVGLRTTTSVPVEAQAYQKALKRLTKYGLTETEAKASLRYTQPTARIVETKGTIEVTYGEAIKKPTIKTKAERVTTPEARVIDEALGIKTRKGERTIEFVKGTGEQALSKGDVILFDSILESQKAYLTKTGAPFSKVREAGKTTTVYRQVTGLRFEKEADFIKLTKAPVTTKAPVEIYKEQTLLKQIIPSTKDIISEKGELIVFKPTKKTPTLEIDMESLLKIKIREAVKRPKQPTGKKIEDFTKQDVKKLIKNLEQVYGKPAPTPAKIPSRAPVTTKEIMAVPTPTLPPSASPVKSVKDISKITSKLDKAMSKSLSRDIAGVSSLIKLEGRIKQLPRTRQDTRLDQRTKEELKQATRLGLSQAQAQQQKQALRLNIKQLLGLKQLTAPAPAPSRIVTTFKPVTTTTKTPKIILPSLDISREVLKAEVKKVKVEKVLALTPSFSAKALGLDPIKVKQVNVKKLLKKMRLGLTPRAPVIVK